MTTAVIAFRHDKTRMMSWYADDLEAGERAVSMLLHPSVARVMTVPEARVMEAFAALYGFTNLH